MSVLSKPYFLKIIAKSKKIVVKKIVGSTQPWIEMSLGDVGDSGVVLFQSFYNVLCVCVVICKHLIRSILSFRWQISISRYLAGLVSRNSADNKNNYPSLNG